MGPGGRYVDTEPTLHSIIARLWQLLSWPVVGHLVGTGALVKETYRRRQALLEIDAAVALDTRYNGFGTQLGPRFSLPKAAMLPQNARDHLAKYWLRARESFQNADYPMAAFFAITLIEEVGKVVLLGNSALEADLDQRAFRNHRQKYAYAVGVALVVNSRLRRVYGDLESRFAAWFREGELLEIRNRALYLEYLDGAPVVPSEMISKEEACLLVCISGEILAEIQGHYTGAGPQEWQSILAEVDEFREAYGEDWGLRGTGN